MSVEDYIEEFNNLSACGGLSKITEQLTSRYLVGLRLEIRNELRIGRIMTLEDALYMRHAEERVASEDYGGFKHKRRRDSKY